MEKAVKIFKTKDGGTRISIFREMNPESPRDTTDEPLHCEDWCRNFSIMNQKERTSRSSSAADLVRHMLSTYGNMKEIVSLLKANARDERHHEGDNALIYDRGRKEWRVCSWVRGFTDYDGMEIKSHWADEITYACPLDELRPYHIVDYLSNDQIANLCHSRYFDGVKLMGYNFGYYGEIHFTDSFSTDDDGIAWLYRDEFLRYSGHPQSYWDEHTCKEMEFLVDELQAYGDGEVYGFVVEELDLVKVQETHQDGSEKSYDREDWNESDSCWGFYGELDKNVVYILDYAGYKLEEVEEVA